VRREPLALDLCAEARRLAVLVEGDTDDLAAVRLDGEVAVQRRPQALADDRVDVGVRAGAILALDAEERQAVLWLLEVGLLAAELRVLHAVEHVALAADDELLDALGVEVLHLGRAHAGELVGLEAG